MTKNRLDTTLLTFGSGAAKQYFEKKLTVYHQTIFYHTWKTLRDIKTVQN